MSWLNTLFTALVTAALGTVLSGYVATQAIRWYRISGFEGKSGYYMVAMAFLGLIAGFIIGVIVSRVVASSANPGVLKSLGISMGITALLVAVVGTVGRLKADVPPEIDGETLMLIVEARWPATQIESPANTPGISFLQLGSVSSRVQRASNRGAFWKEDARQVDGRWTATGAVFLFTERGDRVVSVALSDTIETGIVIRLPARPGTADLEWSGWYPTKGKNGPVIETEINYRYRVQKVSQPIRTETLGNSTVAAIANSFDHTAAPGTTTLDPQARFEVRYKGQPITFNKGSAPAKYSGMLAVIPSIKPALIVYVEDAASDSYCSMLVDDGNTLTETKLGSCYGSIKAEALTSDSAAFERSKAAKPPRGRIDRNTFASSPLMLFSSVVLNTRTLETYPVSEQVRGTIIPSVPPLGISPDQKSYVRFHYGEAGESEPLLTVFDFARSQQYELPIDRVRMRYAELKDFTPAWVAHHFEWQRGADGADALVVRKNFAPIPYAGTISDDSTGKWEYRIPVGGQTVRTALMEHIETKFGGKREQVDATAYEYPIVVDGKKIMVASTGDNDYIYVSLAHGEAPSDIVARIGRSFNAVLATGSLDALFVK